MISNFELSRLEADVEGTWWKFAVASGAFFNVDELQGADG